MIGLQHHTVTEEIQEGEGAILYRGYRNVDRVPVMVKVLKGEYPSAKALGRLRHEYAMLKDLDLPGVVKVLGLEKWKNGLALILEDFGGWPLHDALSVRRLELDEILRIGAAVAEALGAIHRRHIIHKDVRPHKIFISAGARDVKLIDFSISTRVSQDTPSTTSSHVLEGALAYISPEQTGRMNRAIDHRSDLYSLGVTLYEMLTGTLPFTATTPMELVHSHIARVPVPPHELSPDTPKIVSDIVMKLLSKAPEDRYHRGDGLRVDLEECLRQWKQTGKIVDFPVAEHDPSSELPRAQKLSGRESELGRMAVSFERVSQGHVELLLVTGHAGSGKSALAAEIEKVIAGQPGTVIRGSFDKMGPDVPYSAVSQAFGSLVQQILSKSAGEQERVKRDITRALGSHGAIMVDFIPELDRLLGTLKGRAESETFESLDRSSFAVQSFLHEVATADHPLVLFLDNMQWADAASLRLLQALLTDRDQSHFLAMFAYREDEVGPAHPLRAMLSEVRKAGIIVTELSLGSLGPAAVQDLLISALGRDRGRVMSLAELFLEKTGGNPRLLQELLTLLHEEKLLFFHTGAFTWDMRRVGERVHAYDRAAHLAGRIQRLTPGARRSLLLASCIGQRFYRSMLAALASKPLAVISADLAEAVRERLVGTVGPDEPVVSSRAAGEARPLTAGVSSAEALYEFVHPDVRQAVHSLLPDDQRQKLLLQIGRHLLGAGEPLRPADRFRAVGLLDAAGIQMPARERQDLAHQPLLAGQKARALAAYEAAEALLRIGLAWLGEPSVDGNHDLAFRLRFELAQCAHLSGQSDKALALLEALLPHARSNVQRASLYTLQLSVWTRQGRAAGAVSAGLAGLALFGIEIPESEEARREALEREMADLSAHLGRRKLSDLVAEPFHIDPASQALTRLVADLLPLLQAASPTACALVAVKQASTFLKQGHSERSAFVYAVYGQLLSTVFHQTQQGLEFAKLAAGLNDRPESAPLASRVHLLLGAYGHFDAPRRAMLGHFLRAHEAGLAVGDLLYACHACDQAALVRFDVGDELGSVREQVERFLVLTRRAREPVSTAGLTLQRQAILTLMGATTSRTGLSDESVDEAAFVTTLEHPDTRPILYRYHVLKLQILFHHEDYMDAAYMGVQAEQRMGPAVEPYLAAELSFYLCLTLAELCPPSPDEVAQWSADLESHRQRLATLAQSCPQQLAHKHLLVLAEIARLSGDGMKAADLYDEAIRKAKEAEVPRDEALSNELAAKFYLSVGRDKVARAYMTDAYYGYLRWGAVAKVESLAERYSRVLPESAASPGRPSPSLPPGAMPTTLRSGQEELLDVVAVMRAAQAIAREIVLEQVLERMMRILVQNAGAQRGVLLLNREDRLTIEASMSLNPDRVQVGPSTEAVPGADVPLSIVQEVVETQSPVVLDDPARHSRFGTDRYLVEKQPRSVLCMPMMQRRRLTGVLYLENNATRNAFTPARVEICGLLSSQAAIAVENALLYAHVNDVTDKLRRSNENLEQQVERRTEELRLANQRLREELTERERAEDARASLHAEVLRVQAERLLELSTPLIPINDRIMVMPLIGTIDQARARQMVETALHGVEAAGAEFVILELTGVKDVDAAVATTLISTARALGLLGTQVVITGIRPAVAQMLVGLGFDLRAMVTKATLESGIAYAMRKGR
jgi:predicted ATPase/GAF domain-containing protein